MSDLNLPRNGEYDSGPEFANGDPQILDSFPISQEKAYTVRTSRTQGEIELARIAAYASREYLWTFDESVQTWRHHPGQYRENIEKDGEHIKAVQMGMTVPPELHEPFSEETSMYHIHPATEVADEIADLKNQLPSQDDLDAVRASGKRHLSLPGITLAYDEMVGWARTMETVPAITRAVAEMTSGLSGIISVKIEPFSETEEL